ncbi:MAG: hypothetical protein WBP12_02650 [Candidatus Saccharimonas sp.]
MERQNPTEIITDELRAELLLRQAALRQELATVVTKLEALEGSSEQQRRIRMRLRSHWAEPFDNDYFIEHKESNRYPAVTFDITTSNISLAYLVMLAKQNHPIPDPYVEPGDLQPYLAIYIQSTELPDGTTGNPPRDLRKRLSDSRHETAELIQALRKKVVDENHDAKNNASVIDYLLRKEILNHCRQQDPDILIQSAL